MQRIYAALFVIMMKMLKRITILSIITRKSEFISTILPLLPETVDVAYHVKRWGFTNDSIVSYKARKKAAILVSVQLIIYLERLRRKTFLSAISPIFTHSLALEHNHVEYFAIYH